MSIKTGGISIVCYKGNTSCEDSKQKKNMIIFDGFKVLSRTNQRSFTEICVRNIYEKVGKVTIVFNVTFSIYQIKMVYI